MRSWPFFRLSITTPRLELRYPSLEDLDELAERAAEGVHEAGVMPFLFPWSEAAPAERAHSTIQYHFRQWGELSPAKWSLDFVVVFEGRIVGTQALAGRDFTLLREVSSGSWLGRRFQGMGIGTEMRGAVLHLAFAGLGAEYATTEAFEDNHSSIAVTRKFGYHDDGITLHRRQGRPVVTRNFRLPRADWTPVEGIEIHHLGPCLPLLGL
ncbi:GNAT family protein [Nonomuraea sp. NPDC049486]|jgi:RimJ/RimL family protein N-acetyltransferase|uniref:GNAT family N-acetyltransferase n=1 Tax=Nonomuraea harbinensis TaxID=1286938 RepID=A0ABW1BQK7_9ACTN|nr:MULTISPECIES: GNAT family protein [Nonomuraea]TXK43402.1 GNAT family N-acetyltransferase [Nonomuraea sp. C10]